MASTGRSTRAADQLHLDRPDAGFTIIGTSKTGWAVAAGWSYIHSRMRQENSTLKRLLAGAELAKAALKEIAQSNFLARNPGGRPSRTS
jgi:hypothetical protein